MSFYGVSYFISSYTFYIFTIQTIKYKIMKIKFLLLGLSIILTTSFSFGQAAGNMMYSQKQTTDGMFSGLAEFNDNIGYDFQALPQSYVQINDTVTVLTSNILMNVEADSYVVILGVSQIDENLEKCHEVINSRMKKFSESLAAMDISGDDIYVDFISQVPIFEYSVEKKLFSTTYHEIPKGFEIKKNIHLHYKNKDIVDMLLIEAAKNEIYDIIAVDYVIDDIEAKFDILRKKAVEKLGKKVADFQTIGISFNADYQPVAEKVNSIYPIQRYSKYKSFNSHSKGSKMGGSFKKLQSTNQVDIFYNKGSYSKFGHVINPAVVEPTVQFVYSLSVKYVLKRQ